MAYNTGNPLGSTDPRDLSDNSENLDRALNSDSDTWTNRLGQTRTTLRAGEIASQEVVDTADAAKEDINAQVDGLRGEVDTRLNDILIAGGRIFDSEAQGRTAVENEQYYYAASKNPEISKNIWQRVSAEESRLVVSEPSSGFVENVENTAKEAYRPPRLRNVPRSRKNSNKNLMVSLGGVDAHLAVIRSIPRGANRSGPGIQLIVGDSVVSDFSDNSNPETPAFKYSYPVEYKFDRGIAFVRNVDAASQVFLNVDGQEYQLTAGADNWSSPSVINDGVVRALSISNNNVSTLFKTGLSVKNSNTVLHKVITGQSLALGSRGFVLTNNPDDYEYSDGLYVSVFTKSVPVPLDDRCLTLEGGPRPASPSGSTRFESSREYINDPLGETIVSSWAIAMALWDRAQIGMNAKYLGTISAFGGSPYESLKKGTVTYNNALNHVTNANEIAADSGNNHIVSSVSIIHGESQTGTTSQQYLEMLQEWAADYQTDIKAITGQSFDPFVLISQANTGESGTQPAIPVAQLQAHIDGYVTLVCPKYQFRYFDTFHLYAEGYVKLGELEAKAEKFLLVGKRWEPLYPKEFELTSSDEIRVTFNNQIAGSDGTPGPIGRLAFDTDTVQLSDNHGFELLGNTILDVKIGIDGNSVTIKALSGLENGQQLTYAAQENGGGVSNRRRGNLRDSDSRDVSRYDNSTLYNWCVAFTHEITGMGV